MFVHSLWSETSDPLQAFASKASELLGSPMVATEQSFQWTREVKASDDSTSPDLAWEAPLGEATAVRQPVSLYQIASYTGIASADPTINFRIRDYFDERFKISPARLNWAEKRPQSVGEWSLCAIHLRDPSTDIEVITQGGVKNLSALVGQIDRFDDYDVFGVSLASHGRLVTMYDEGQLWLQQVLPDDVPKALEPIVVELLSENDHA